MSSVENTDWNQVAWMIIGAIVVFGNIIWVLVAIYRMDKKAAIKKIEKEHEYKEQEQVLEQMTLKTEELTMKLVATAQQEGIKIDESASDKHPGKYEDKKRYQLKSDEYKERMKNEVRQALAKAAKKTSFWEPFEIPKDLHKKSYPFITTKSSIYNFNDLEQPLTFGKLGEQEMTWFKRDDFEELKQRTFILFYALEQLRNKNTSKSLKSILDNVDSEFTTYIQDYAKTEAGLRVIYNLMTRL